MSRRLMLITFTGRRSSKRYTTHISYVQQGNTLLLGVGGSWWKNLRGGVPVRVRVRSKIYAGRAEAWTDEASMTRAYQTILAHNPTQARFMGIRATADGQPVSRDIRQELQRLEETLQICLRMWQGEKGDERPFEGKHYHIERPFNIPQSLTRPHPPILIAGSGEQKTLRLVARYADACNLRPGPEIPKKLEILRQHCEAEGRDYDTIEKTCMFAFDVGEDGPKVDELIGQLRWLASTGIQTVLGVVPHVYRITPLEIIEREVIPAVADL